MDAAEVARADTDPVIRARLDSCVFKGAMKENGQWRTVPMCAMNERKWAEVYDERLRDATLLGQSQPWNGPGSSDKVAQQVRS
jgi:hypothetical protein